jgi:prepilin-type N-terminal cleavage/methylation domain-containing protein
MAEEIKYRGRWLLKHEARVPRASCPCCAPALATRQWHPASHSPLTPRPSPLARRGFTLVELLITITIIGIVAGLSLGALQRARRFAAEEKTRATIAKLDAIVQRRVDEFVTRRLPVSILPGTQPQAAAWIKLNALREVMRMELPDSAWDITNGPQPLPTQFDPSGNNPLAWETPPQTLRREPAKHLQYRQKGMWLPSNIETYDQAQALYLIVASVPSDLEQFTEAEIGTVGNRRVFVDGWSKPIMWLRWAPGYPMKWDTLNSVYVPSSASSPQARDPKNDHDPFDSRKVDMLAFKLIPLIYSAGPDGKYGLWIGAASSGLPVPTPDGNGHIRPLDSHAFDNTPLNQLLGEISRDNPQDYQDNITNHDLETQ